MEDLETTLRKHPFLEGLAPEHVRVLVGCARNVRYHAGDFISREGDVEPHLLLLREGTLALETRAPGGEPICIETLQPGDVLGVSQLTPRAAHFDCRARDAVLAVELDRDCLKRKMDADPALGYAISSRLLERTYQRLSRIRLQNLDVYK
jgi:CRP/FNR family cyclic AMP-dependent transcriptional regulator